MSSNRLDYDVKAYEKTINESVGPGYYQLSKPSVGCKPCFNNNPDIRLQYNGNSIAKDKLLIDVDSELMGLTRNISKDPNQKYQKPDDDDKGNPKIDINLQHFDDCHFPVEHTKLSNPPCTLRGTGWNRWEWLCKNPQENVIIPFDWNINDKLLAKDNHRPCIPTPIDQTNVLPDINSELPKEKIDCNIGVFTGKLN